MPKSDNQKAKIFLILDYLKRNSNEDHYVTANELIDMLDAHGISCERKTIYSDIKTLNSFDNIEICRSTGKNGGYYLVSSTFELEELKLLIDAVQSSRFLTEEMATNLIKKLYNETNKYDAQQLSRNVYVTGRVKTMNDSVYKNIGHISAAIDEGVKVTFRYFDLDLKGKRVYRNKTYKVSPYGLCQDNGNCYLMALSDHGITSYRVDRISNVLPLADKRDYCPELTGKNFHTYVSGRFQMFSGEKTSVKLRFHRELTGAIFDRFGQDIMMIPDGPDYFNVTVEVAVSRMFLSWVMGFGNKAKILYPQRIVDQCKELCQEIMDQY